MLLESEQCSLILQLQSDRFNILFQEKEADQAPRQEQAVAAEPNSVVLPKVQTGPSGFRRVFRNSAQPARQVHSLHPGGKQSHKAAQTGSIGRSQPVHRNEVQGSQRIKLFAAYRRLLQ